MTPDIKKILDEIDGLREKSTQGEWVYGGGGDIDEDFWVVGEKSESVVHRGSDSDGGANETNAALIVALHNSYPILRDYIARLERESEAGAALAKDLKRFTATICARGCHECDAEEEWEDMRNSVLSSYRTACEGEEK